MAMSSSARARAHRIVKVTERSFVKRKRVGSRTSDEREGRDLEPEVGEADIVA